MISVHAFSFNMYICKILLDILPITMLALLFFLPRKKGRITAITPWISLAYTLVLIVCIAGYPSEMATDGDRYVRGYYNALYYGVDLEYKDIGWIVYEVICANLFGNSIWFFWICTASIYVLSYYFFCRSYFDKKELIYILTMFSGMLGFANYGTNVIRHGIAIALVFYALRKNENKYIRLCLLIVSLFFHKSMLLFIVSFYISFFLKNDRNFFYLWLCCLFLSFINFDLGFIFDKIGFVDSRVEGYSNSMGDSSDNGYNVGFRWDFIIYSFVPIMIALYYIKKSYLDDYYRLFVRIYLCSNSLWLLAIRIPYTDRLAYLSWCLIPVVTLYPLLDRPSYFQSPQKRVFQVMLLFMSVCLALQLR